MKHVELSVKLLFLFRVPGFGLTLRHLPAILAQMIEAWISMGSNLEEPEEQLVRARVMLARLPECVSIDFSSVYWTEPQMMQDQPWFANQVARVRCDAITAENFLAKLQHLETRLGRKRDPAQRFGPRAMDLDLLLFGAEVRNEASLTLPHPRMYSRAFVLIPLQELAPEFILPCGKTSAELLRQLDYRVEGMKIYQN